MASSGEAEAARPVRMPPSAPAAPPLPKPCPPWRTRRHLNRLARVLRRHGWTAQLRHAEPRPLLRVFSESVPTIGESVTVAQAHGVCWYRASTGKWLAPCTEVERAANALGALLTPWVSAALTARTRKAE
ncbi:hypothetical protein GCM10022214_70390 [Actinomadura miaoliensis]|uniref:Uncharacterized protein n=1 Tax=Actinomadura miaoliensis TaxID=430685 RepID=A0ABP7WTN2_9ACTN